LAERVLAFSGKRLGTKDTQETLGLVRPELLRAFSDAVFNGDARAAVEQLRQAVQFGQSSRGLLLAAGEMWHQLTCCVVDQSLLDSEPDAAQLDWLRAWAGRWDIQALDLRYQVLIAGLRDMAWMDEGRGAEMLAMRLASLHRLQPPANGEVPPEIKKQLPVKDQAADSQRAVSEAEKGESRALAAEPAAQYVAEEAAPPAAQIETEADNELPFDGQAPGFQYGDWAEAVHAYAQIRPNIAAQFEHAVCLEFGHKVRVAGAALHEETIPVAERLAFAEWLGREVHWESGASQAGESLSQAKQREAEQMRQHMRETAEADPHVKLLREELGAELVNVYAAGVGRDGGL
ncbi:MAG: DNA polymerase III subunit gamma/tau, partial [Mariprofundaceae bacterium]